MGEVTDLSSDSQSSAGSTSALALDISAVSYESGRRALQLAVDGDGSIEEIASLLEEEAEEHQNSSSLDPTDGSSSNETPVGCDHHTALEVAASAGHRVAVERLLKAGADPNGPVHEKGSSVLEAAAGQGHLLVVQKLLEAGAHPDHRGQRSDATPLIAAAAGGHLETCEALLQSGANFCISINCWDDLNLHLGTSSAIEAAAGTSSITLLELFLAAVEDLAKDFDQDELEATMAEARQQDSQRLFRTRPNLRSARGSINQALVKAGATGNMLVLQRLLDAGADVTAKSHPSNPNAIEAAASRGHVEAMNQLIQTCSDQNNLPLDAVTSALQWAVDFGVMAPIEPLLQAGADATNIDIRPAATGAHLDVLKFMLQSGAIVDEPPWDFEIQDVTALQLAASHGHQAVVEVLLAHGADVNRCVGLQNGIETGIKVIEGMEGATAISFAAVGGHLAVVKQLVEAGADVNALCMDRDTALEAAVRAGDMAMVELLLEAGAIVDVPRHWRAVQKGGTALSIAAEVDNPDLVARLLSIMPKDDARMATPLALQKAAENQNADIVQQLLQLHTDANLDELKNEVEDGILLRAALQSASERGDLAVVKLLLAAGVEVNGMKSTVPPLLLAIRGGHVHVFEHLLAAGADIQSAYGGQKMLEAADESGDADIQDCMRAVLDSRPLPQADQPLGRDTGQLCEACRSSPLAYLFWDNYFTSPIVLHPSLTALRASAAAGCPFCCFIWKRLGITSIPMFQPSPVTLSTPPPVLPPYTVTCCVGEPSPRDIESERISMSSSASSHGEVSKDRRIIEFPFFLPYQDGDYRVPITEDTSSPETMSQIRTWLDTCRNEHTKCQMSVGVVSLPTRLIYLDAPRDSSLSNSVNTSLQPRLISTNGKECSECKYITLSYRWPEDFPIEAKSTRDNIHEQMRGLNTSKLPQIFNDVFQVAVRLGISYVWIDSLCIIQDDSEDWNREAARMVHIYQHAELTVATAAPPTKPDLGLFRYGDPSDILSVRLPGLPEPWKNGYPDDEVVVMKPQKETCRQSPLISRGWCFQERELSRRVVHYTETQVLWECRSIRASEGLPAKGTSKGPPPNPDDWPIRMLDQRHLTERWIYSSWNHSVHDYSARQLTVFTDKLPALAGLAAAIRNYLPVNCRYLAGLWETNLKSDLLWSSQKVRDGIIIKNGRYPEYVAPTWSWASVAGPVLYGKSCYIPLNPAGFALKILDFDVQTSTNDPFGAVSHAVLRCTAGLLPTLLKENDSSSPDCTDYTVTDENGIRVGQMDFDVPQEKFDDEVDKLFCIHFGAAFRSDHGPGLVILPTGNREDEYRRVGMIESMHIYPFHDIEVKEITLV